MAPSIPMLRGGVDGDFAGAPVLQLEVLAFFAEGLRIDAIPLVGCCSAPLAYLQVVTEDLVSLCLSQRCNGRFTLGGL